METSMGLAKQMAVDAGDSVTVFLGNRKAVKQPDNFRVCPLGIQLYSPRKLPAFEILEFRIRIPGAKKGSWESITCRGVVVRCAPENGSSPRMYRVWVTFLDLPETKRKRIRCMAHTSGLLCPYCENFS